MDDWREELRVKGKEARKRAGGRDPNHGLPPLGAFVTCRDGFEWQVQNHVLHNPPTTYSARVRPLPPRAHVTAPKEHGEPMPAWRWVSAEQIRERDWGYRDEQIISITQRFLLVTWRTLLTSAPSCVTIRAVEGRKPSAKEKTHGRANQ